MALALYSYTRAVSQAGLSLNDLHAELRCLILRLRGANCELSQMERERIENIIWQTIETIDGDTMSRVRFEQLYDTQLKNKAAVNKYKQKIRAAS